MTQEYHSSLKDMGDSNGPKLGEYLHENFETIKSLWSGTSSPDEPEEGQPWLDISEGIEDAVLRFWDGSDWVLVNEYNPYIKDLRVARGSKESLWERLEVSLNEDGTLKDDLEENMTEWIDNSETPSYESADTFTIPGDYTDVFVINRKIKATLDDESVYSAVESADYSSEDDETTVVLFDEVIDNTIQKVEYGLVKAGPEGSNPENNLIDESTENIYELKIIDGSLAMEDR